MTLRAPASPLTPWGPRLAGAALLLGLAACGQAVPAPPVLCREVPQLPQTAGQEAKQEVRAAWQCGPTLDFTPVNSYQGELAGALAAEDAVALINGLCTGTLVAAGAGPVLLTAGHCVRLGDRPLVVFNFEDAPDGDPLITEGTVIEQSLDPDYALIQLDTLPAATPVQLTSRPSDRLAIIQHPRGYRKVIAEGGYLAACHRLVYYTDLDTLVGSSGAGVLTREGHLFGIHTDGDCDETGSGTNRGWTVASVVEASAHLQPEDVAER